LTLLPNSRLAVGSNLEKIPEQLCITSVQCCSALLRYLASFVINVNEILNFD
jgi:hypothetical protein